MHGSSLCSKIVARHKMAPLATQHAHYTSVLKDDLVERIWLVCQAAPVKALGDLLEVGLGEVWSGISGVMGRAAPVNELGDLLEVGLGEAARGEGGRAHAEPAGHQGALVAGHGVLVGGDVRQLHHALHAAAIHALGPQVHQAQVVLGACTSTAHPLSMHHSIIITPCSGDLTVSPCMSDHRSPLHRLLVLSGCRERHSSSQVLKLYQHTCAMHLLASCNVAVAPRLLRSRSIAGMHQADDMVHGSQAD